MKKGAIISECGLYRYQLWRIWNESLPKVLFIMHNPSKATDVEDDNTMTRCVNFAKSWGYGGIYIGNLSPFRETNPDNMKHIDYDVLMPKENEKHVREMMELCELHVLAYGNPIVRLLKPDVYKNKWHYLKLTKQGNPYHPLYLKASLTPIKFTP